MVSVYIAIVLYFAYCIQTVMIIFYLAKLNA